MLQAEGMLRTGLTRLDEGLPSRGVELRDTGRAGHRGHAPQECSWERRDGLFPGVSHFFQYFPFRGQIGPDSKLKARHTEIVSRKFSDPVTIRPMSNFWSTGMPHAKGYADKRGQNKCALQSYQNGTWVSPGQASGKCHQISQVQLPWC